MSKAFKCDRCGDLREGTPFGYVKITRSKSGGNYQGVCSGCHQRMQSAWGDFGE